MPETVAWIHSVRKPVLMKTERAKKQLRWRPQHTARAALKEMAEAQRALRYSSA
jgi:UDP-glucose 4-epimerase